MKLVQHYLLMLTMINQCTEFHFSDPKKDVAPATQSTATLSLTQQFQLDFLYQELNEYPDLFVHDWTSNNSVLLILESAEMSVQNSSLTTQPIMRDRITSLFAQIGINITFSSQNLIIRTDDPTQHHPFWFYHQKKGTKQIKIKKTKKWFTPSKGYKLPTLEKIKGANRTRRRIKEKFAQKERERIENELNAIKEKNRVKTPLNPEEHVDPVRLWQTKLTTQHEQEESAQSHENSNDHFIHGNE